MSLRSSRDIVGRFFTMLNANISLCETKFSITEVNFALGMGKGILLKWFYI